MERAAGVCPSESHSQARTQSRLLLDRPQPAPPQLCSTAPQWAPLVWLLAELHLISGFLQGHIGRLGAQMGMLRGCCQEELPLLQQRTLDYVQEC